MTVLKLIKVKSKLIGEACSLDDSKRGTEIHRRIKGLHPSMNTGKEEDFPNFSAEVKSVR